jgi:4-alpha-glucanotransferase
MTASSWRAGLAGLASSLGVQRSYVDAAGVRRSAPIESVAAVVDALLGYESGDPREELRRLTAESAAEMLDPVSVAWAGRPGRVSVRPKTRASRLQVHIRGEDGFEQAWSVAAADLSSDGAGGAVLSLPAGLAPGYYRLAVKAGRTSASTLVICAPVRAYRDSSRPRDWGVFLPLYALHSLRSPTLGDFSDLRALIEWTEGLGGGEVATLPFLAQFYDDAVFEPSPYAPASRLMWNEAYLDLNNVSPSASVGAPDIDRQSPLVDWRAAVSWKRHALESAIEKDRWPAGPRDSFETFRRENPRVVEYARFRARTHASGPWQSWPAEPRADASEERYHTRAQWLAEFQLSALAAATSRGLYLDLPLGVHPASYDTWRWPGCFLAGLSAGAPPDALAAGGQDWGFPPPNPRVNRANAYEYVVAYVRHHLRFASRLRIDHVMGLHRLFVIPRGAPASRGLYLGYPADELYAIFCLESHRNRAEIVGENLGTVPRYVNQAMRRHALSGMYVLPFEIDPQAETIREPRHDPVASLNTHDLPPFTAWWSGHDIDERESLNLVETQRAQDERAARASEKETALRFLVDQRLLSTGEAGSVEAVRDALLRFLGQSDARLVLANLEDLWGGTDYQNLPGTTEEHPNWRRRAKLGLERITTSPEVVAALAGLDAARRAGR